MITQEQNNVMKKILLISMLYFIICSNSMAQLLPEFIDKGGKIRIYLANSVIGKGIDTTLLSADKIKPALHYITLLNDKYELVSDSLVNDAANKLNSPTAFDIAKEVLADRIFIVKLEQLVNVIRVEIISANYPDTHNARTSEGIAVLHLFKKTDGMPYFDPTILAATQRAFAGIEGDSSMFLKCEEPYNIKPASNIVIAGIEFVNDEKYTNWEVFNNPLIKSFEYSEIIYEAICKIKNYVVFDMESRDALYALFNLFLIENNVMPSYNELAALRRFNVECYITGKIERKINGVDITLKINENTQTSNKIIKSVDREVLENDITKIKNVIKELAKELLAE